MPATLAAQYEAEGVQVTPQLDTALAIAAGLSDLELAMLHERTGEALRARGFVVDQSPLPIASELDEDERPKVADQWGWEAE